MTPDVPDLTRSQFVALLDAAVAALPPARRDHWQRYAVPPVRLVHRWPFRGEDAYGPVWVVARDDAVVLGYDEIEEDFGTGRVPSGPLQEGSVVVDWGGWGVLALALHHFPSSRLAVPEAAG